MKSFEPIIWMNVTTSVNWQRSPVGVVRVEASLGSELQKLYGNQFKYCVWEDGAFLEYFPSNCKAVVGAIPENKIKHKESTKSSLPNIYPILSKRQACIAIAQGLLSLTPKSLRSNFNYLLYFLRPKISRLRRNWLSSILNKKNRNFNNTLAIQNVPTMGQEGIISPFNFGDILISIGLDWDYQCHKIFYELRKKYGVKVVSCCYDLIPVLYPQYCVADVAKTFTSYFLDIADGSDLILCISEQSKKDLNELLESTGGARPHTQVIPLGDNVPQIGSEPVSELVESICKRPFILFVSTIERRKNHEVLYRAYHLICKKYDKEIVPTLVFVGMRGWGVEELFKDIDLDPVVEDMIEILNDVSDTELRLLYQTSLFCVYPSLYEGWGLPVGEALSLGKAIISSDRGSLPEVGGDLVQYVDPWEPHQWASAIMRMASDEAWRKSWQDKVKDRYKIRTWTQTAIAVKESIEAVVENKINE